MVRSCEIVFLVFLLFRKSDVELAIDIANVKGREPGGTLISVKVFTNWKCELYISTTPSWKLVA